MNKLVFAAATALLLATTSAQAGGAVTFQIDGQRIHIESPRGCNSLSCIQINAPGFKGKLGNIDLKGFGSKDKDSTSALRLAFSNSSQVTGMDTRGRSRLARSEYTPTVVLLCVF